MSRYIDQPNIKKYFFIKKNKEIFSFIRYSYVLENTRKYTDKIKTFTFPFQDLFICSFVSVTVKISSLILLSEVFLKVKNG